MESYEYFLGPQVKKLTNLEPNTLLFLFLPILVLEVSFNSDWYTFKRTFKNILVLSGPAFLLGSFLVSFLLFLMHF